MGVGAREGWLEAAGGALDKGVRTSRWGEGQAEPSVCEGSVTSALDLYFSNG